MDVFYVVDAKRADAALVDALRRAAGEEHRLGGRLTAHRDVRRIEQSPLDELTLADPGTPSRSHA
ncbi:hypothetical protein ACFW2V_25100 [Streptomyces sp. NPDC058947]|uniref:hypothetical protein n=1 Tax=Streptomyces sp. NPDC058947 TaxID=3346675 RepID=UPI0036792DD7